MPRRGKPNTTASTPRRKRRAPLRLTAKQAHETIKKAQALQRLGLYSPREKVTARTKFDKRQERNIARRFNALQAQAVSVPGKGMQRPLKRGSKGYVLTDAFRVDRRRIKAPDLHVIPTAKGSIVPRKAGALRVRKDGTVVSTQTIFGKARTVYSGTLTPGQSLKFMDDALTGKFKFPKDTMIRVSLFGSNLQSFTSISALKKWLAKYSATIIKGSNKGFQPLTMEYIPL